MPNRAEAVLLGHVKEKEKSILDALNYSENQDINVRHLSVLGQESVLIYIDGMADSKKVDEFILPPLLFLKGEKKEDVKAHLASSLLSTSFSFTNNLKSVVNSLLGGDTALLVEQMDTVCVIDTKGYVHRNVEQPTNERVVMGAKEAFNESLKDNIALVKQFVRSPFLTSQKLAIGRIAPCQVCVMYLKNIAREDIVSRVKQRLMDIQTDAIESAGALEQFLEDAPYCLFPQILKTERPDRVLSFLKEGQVIVLLQNAPYALVMPLSFFHLFHAPDDYGLRFLYSCFIRALRLIGLLVAVYLPCFFVALSMHHLEGMSLALSTSIMESQSNVPLSLFLSTLFMLVIFSLLNEAATRVPSVMGTSLSIVGGLILGTAAIQADIVSPVVIIVVALSGIGSFSVPDYPLTLCIRILQMIYVVFAGFFGFFGIAMFSFYLFSRVLTLTSFGAPYFAPLYPKRPSNMDGIFRLPVFLEKVRGYLVKDSALYKKEGKE